jgi:hypothetical protein
MKKFFITLSIFTFLNLKSQLAGDGFTLSTDRNWRGRSELRKEIRHYRAMRKYERYIGKKYGAKAAQRFIRKKHHKRPKKSKEKTSR